MTVVRLVGIVLLLLGVKANQYFHQYHLILESKTWTEAQRYCREKYTDLATVDNMEDMNQLMAVGNGYSGGAWLGLLRANTGSWQWSGGSRDLPYTNWADNEPNNINGTENCVEINSLGKWKDLPCQTQNYVACNEYVKGEPVYVVHSRSRSWTWNTAQSHCKNSHEDMAVVLSKEDNDVIRGLASNHTVWIGLFRDYWEWSDQSATYFRYWKGEKPDNYGGNQNCVLSLLGEQGVWDNAPCEGKFPFFCHGPLKSKLSVVKIRILSTSDPNELGIPDQLLQQLQVQLGNLRVSDYRLSWKVQQDGKIFQEEEEGPEQKGGCDVEEGYRRHDMADPGCKTSRPPKD